MRYKEGVDKQQLTLLPASLDDYVPEDHMCRVIYAFSERLDMAGLRIQIRQMQKDRLPPLRSAVEHPFGTIKAVRGYKQFLCRTKAKVAAETALAYLVYNIRRIIDIFAGNRLKLTFG